MEFHLNKLIRSVRPGNRFRNFAAFSLWTILILLVLFPSASAEADTLAAGGQGSFWMCLGPFENPGDQGLDRDWLAAFGGERAFLSNPALTLARLHEASPTLEIKAATPAAEGFIDFISAFGPMEDKVAYAWRSFDCPRDGFAVLKAGSDDGIRAWINGREVITHHIHRGAAPDQEIVPVRLKAGPNRCFVKVDQGIGAWGFYFSFSEITPQEEGLHLKAIGPLQPPVLLLGAQIPIEQTLSVPILNYGTKPARDFYLTCRSPDLDESRSEVVSCTVGGLTEATLVFQAAPQLKPDRTVRTKLEAVLSDGTRIPLTEVQTRTRLAHPQLREKTGNCGKPFSVIHLTDPHIVLEESELSGVRTAEQLKQAVAEINAMNPAPEFVVVTGDILLNDPRGYAVYERIMSALKVPYVSAFGNHDKPSGLAAAERAFSEWGLPPYYAFVHRGYLFVILDTVASANPPDGALVPRQLRWLDRVLEQYQSQPSLFFCHHDLFSGLGVTNLEPLQEIFEKHPGEKWIFSGHWHSDCFVRSGDQRHVITTATGYIFPEDRLKHDRNVSGYRLIHFKDGAISTQLKPLGGEALPDPDLKDYYTPKEVLHALGIN